MQKTSLHQGYGRRTCVTCGSPFAIHPDEEAFLQKMTWTFGDTKVALPLPDTCPVCRSQLRVAHRNERYLYRTPAANTGKETITLFAPEPLWGPAYKVLSQEDWRSDGMDPMSYGRDFDFSRPFFEQWSVLHKSVPRMALTSLGNENSDFSTGTGYCKNCYLINSSEYCEDCYYGKLFQKCKTSADCSYLFDSELCYQCFSVYHSYGCQYVNFSQNCQDCFFSSNLRGCKNCCLCTNLDHKEYHFLNQPLSREDYEQRLKEFRGSFERTEQMRTLLAKQMTSMIRKYTNIVNSEDCTGDYIENSKSCIDCYDVSDGQDCRNVFVGVQPKDLYDCSNMYIKPELCYQILGVIETFHSAYCIYVFHSQNMLYCEYCFSCNDCFGCNGLTRKKYCIFNKQYSKEEYEILVPKIIEKMKQDGEFGQFFPARTSPFGYNESVAQEYYPLTKEEALKRGFYWREMSAKGAKPQAVTLPDRIENAKDDVLQALLACSSCKRNYRIIPQELTFYRNNRIPLPRQCPDCRYDERLALRNPRRLWQRSCMKCKKEIETTYGPERLETVYCEQCYLKTVY